MPSAHQSSSFIPLLNWTGKRKYSEGLMGQYKDRKTSLTYYHPGKKGQNRFDWGNNLIILPITSEQDNKK